MKLVFATNNRHKLEEISAIIGDKIEILGLNDIGCRYTRNGRYFRR